MRFIMVQAPPDKAPGELAHVLVVDDNPMNAKIITLALARLGCSVEVCTLGMEAVESLQNRPCDIVFLDIHLPDIDGFEVTKRIRGSAPPVCTIPIIAVTADVIRFKREDCLQAGMNDYISRPAQAHEYGKALVAQVLRPE